MSELSFTIATNRIKYNLLGCEGPLQQDIQTTTHENKRENKQMEKTFHAHG